MGAGTAGAAIVAGADFEADGMMVVLFGAGAEAVDALGCLSGCSLAISLTWASADFAGFLWIPPKKSLIFLLFTCWAGLRFTGNESSGSCVCWLWRMTTSLAGVVLVIGLSALLAAIQCGRGFRPRLDHIFKSEIGCKSNQV